MTSFVIPSYQRPDITKNQTLAFLKKHGIEDTDIYLVLRKDDLYLNDYLDRATNINILMTDVRGVGRTHLMKVHSSWKLMMTYKISSIMNAILARILKRSVRT